MVSRGLHQSDTSESSGVGDVRLHLLLRLHHAVVLNFHRRRKPEQCVARPGHCVSFHRGGFLSELIGSFGLHHDLQQGHSIVQDLSGGHCCCGDVFHNHTALLPPCHLLWAPVEILLKSKIKQQNTATIFTSKTKS